MKRSERVLVIAMVLQIESVLVIATGSQIAMALVIAMALQIETVLVIAMGSHLVLRITSV